MKKVLAVLLAALLFAAPALAQTTSLAGEWTLTKTIASGMVIAPEVAGVSQTLVLNPDGTCMSHSILQGTPMDESGTWTQNGSTISITSSLTGETNTLMLQSDGTLLAMVDGVAMYFTQTAAAPQATAIPQVPVMPQTTNAPQATRAPGGGLLPSGLLPAMGDTDSSTGDAACTADGFEGQWVLTQAAANGQTFDAAALGVQMTVTINADGTCTVWDGEEMLSCTWTQNGSTVNVTEPEGYVTAFTLRADGTISADIEGITLILARQGVAAVPSPASLPAVSGQTATGKGFTVQVPQGWMELNEATLQQLIQTYGQAAVDAAGLRQQLQYIQSMGILLYYSPDLNSSVNVAQESAQGVTMESLLSLEASYAAAYANAGMANYDMAGPVTFSGRTYYTGTYDAAYPTTQYYHIVNGVFYTITLTNVADADATTILGSFTVNQ